MSLLASKPKLQADIYKLLEDGLEKAFKATFMTAENCDDADDMAKNFAQKGAMEMAPKMADAIHSYVSSMDITLVPTTLVTSTGPITGTANTQTKQITIL